MSAPGPLTFNIFHRRDHAGCNRCYLNRHIWNLQVWDTAVESSCLLKGLTRVDETEVFIRCHFVIFIVWTENIRISWKITLQNKWKTFKSKSVHNLKFYTAFSSLITLRLYKKEYLSRPENKFLVTLWKKKNPRHFCMKTASPKIKISF